MLVALTTPTALLLSDCGAAPTAGPPVVATAPVVRGRPANQAQVSGRLAAVRRADLFTLTQGRVTG